MAQNNTRKNKLTPQQQIAYHEEQVRLEREKWDRYRREGTSDRWPDGVGLNLTRNHIIYHLFEIAAIRASDNPFQLSIWDDPQSLSQVPESDRRRVMQDSRIPPEVNYNFMVRPREDVAYVRPEDLVYEP